ncbi:hypothetical protein [Nodularia chucula]|uniref:hypothetical protein n=1 Tax=Nodularia chucula TaxID=3093667 RepID=UPI0039C60FA3
MGSYDSEVLYCGHCNTQQQVSQGEKCKSCRRTTISWYPDRQSHEDIRKKWIDMCKYFHQTP